MQAHDNDIDRTAGLFIVRHGANASTAARLKYEELTLAGYAASADTAIKVLAAIRLLSKGPTELKAASEQGASEREPESFLSA
jgi:hypothetical protein